MVLPVLGLPVGQRRLRHLHIASICCHRQLPCKPWGPPSVPFAVASYSKGGAAIEKRALA